MYFTVLVQMLRRFKRQFSTPLISICPVLTKVNTTTFNALFVETHNYYICVFCSSCTVEWKIVVEFLEKGLKINPSAFVSGSNSDGPGIPGSIDA